MTKKERYRAVIEWFVQHMPVAESELIYKNPYQLVVAVVLSAQCTDKRVNLVTPMFFERFPDASSLSEASEQDIYNFIKSVTY
ncbi:MAG: endonuclease III, partial [Bacteroidales bacterium]|nr:endonuclease III [Bacteroidales bacterium]